MGCVSSKQTVSVTPALDDIGDGGRYGMRGGSPISIEISDDEDVSEKKSSMSEVGDSRSVSSSGRSYDQSFSFRLGNLQKYVQAGQVAAGWPAWLSAVAGEAIHGWIPLKLDRYKKLDKIGQGTYSTVYRARDVETGKLVALKKVRFDSFEPESVRFMAREIMILRRLNHPNIIKLEGIICSRLSSGIYLVFEYMEHDITGLLSCPDIKFSEPQIKCYMKQLLSGLSHCHSLGIMHRDIKGSNLLVNNEGVLKVADFGLANFCSSRHRQPLTSRVVTLWYRPPELLLGSTDYGASVDLWSVGCVFAELLQGKPILQGRTEVEQLHKIFKLCGSPPAEYWKKSKLPHATLYKPQQPYDSCLRETFEHLQATAVNLIETLLSVEPYKRGTASSAIASEYFTTEPFACDPSSLPVYPPSKEIDSKNREDAKRKKNFGRVRGPELLRRMARKPPSINKLAPAEDLTIHTQITEDANRNKMRALKEDCAIGGDVQNLAFDKAEKASHAKNASQGDIPFSGPLQVSTSSGFAWAKRRKDEVSVRSHHRSISRGHVFNELDPVAALHSRNNDSTHRDRGDVMNGLSTDSSSRDLHDVSKHSMQKRWGQMGRPDSFDASDGYYSQELSVALYQRGELASRRNNLEYKEEAEKVEFSGPLITQSHKVDEFLERHERHIRQVVRKSWFQKMKKHSK